MLEGNLEENVLALLCFSEEHAHTVALEVPTDLFSTRVYKTIADAAVKYLYKYNKPPGPHLKDILEKRINKGDEGKLILNTINLMVDMYPKMQPVFMLEEVAKFVRHQRLVDTAGRLAASLDKGELDAAEEILAEGQPQQSTAFSEGTWAHDDKKMLSFLDKPEEDTFTFGIEALELRGVAPARKTMSVMIAPAKFGKSWFLIGAAKSNLMAGKKVLHITLENAEDLTAKRYIQAFYGMTKSEVKGVSVPVFSRDEFGRVVNIDFEELVKTKTINERTRVSVAAKLRKLKSRPRLLIKEFAPNSLTIGNLNSYLNMLAKQHNFVPDLIVYDYLNLTYKKGVDIRQELGHIAVSLRGLAVSKNVALITATQGNRGSATAKVVRNDMVGEDWSIIATADLILNYTRTLAEKQSGLGRMLVGGSRDSEDEFMILLAQSYATGQFCLDSTYLTSKVSTIMGDLFGEKKDGR